MAAALRCRGRGSGGAAGAAGARTATCSCRGCSTARRSAPAAGPARPGAGAGRARPGVSARGRRAAPGRRRARAVAGVPVVQRGAPDRAARRADDRASSPACSAAPVRGYDFIWLRNQPRRHGIQPHCDLVFMGRGTPDVLTCWTPFGDIPLGGGGLMLLEDSHRQSVGGSPTTSRQDVDTYCENGPNADAVRNGTMRWEHWEGPRPGATGAARSPRTRSRCASNGAGAGSPRRSSAWATCSVFTMRTVHAGTDNETPSCGCRRTRRYQRADAPVDERWVRGEHGEAPVGHGLGRQGRQDLLMQRRRLGRTEREVSEIGFGAWPIGGDWGEVDEDDAMARCTGRRRRRELLRHRRRLRRRPQRAAGRRGCGASAASFYVATKAGRRAQTDRRGLPAPSTSALDRPPPRTSGSRPRSRAAPLPADRRSTTTRRYSRISTTWSTRGGSAPTASASRRSRRP